MNKKEIIDKIDGEIQNSFSNEHQSGKEAGLTYALELVKKLDEPEKTVVSKLEAEWLDELKANYRCRENQLYVITRQGWGNGFCFNCHGEQIELSYEPYEGKEGIKSVKRRLVNAILYGYEVEKEKLYTVEIPNPHGLGHTVLVKDMYGNIFITYVMNSDWRKSKVNQLTEAEIKKDFEWAWQFAKEV